MPVDCKTKLFELSVLVNDGTGSLRQDMKDGKYWTAQAALFVKKDSVQESGNIVSLRHSLWGSLTKALPVTSSTMSL